MTEQELRQQTAAAAIAWLGCKESDGSHRKIIDLYNAHTPLARGYKMAYTDAWCAAFVSAVAIRCGLTDIMPTECSCAQMTALYKQLGRWQEDDAYIPSPGDLIMYDWDDTGAGDCTGAPEHVGIVTQVSGSTITVIEGNNGHAVKYRTMKVNGRYIRGYCVPDYAGKANLKGENIEMTKEEIQLLVDAAVRAAQPQVYTAVDQVPEWARPLVEQAIGAGIIRGNGVNQLCLTADNLINLQMLSNAGLF